MQCKATSKRTHQRCGAQAIAGREVCRHHGGKTPSGIGSPHFRTGRWSRDLPAHLATRYQQALADPDRLAMDSEIAVLDSRLADLFKQLSTEETGEWLRRLAASWERFDRAQRSGDTAAAGRLLRAHGTLIERLPVDTSSVWAQIESTIEARRRLVESERKRLLDSQQYLTVERAMLLFSALLDLVRRHVTDRAALQAIAEGARRLTAVDASTVAVES